jgi:hypothetical protein
MENVLRLLLAETSTLSAASGSAPENKLGMLESLFTLQVLDPAFENWIRCNSSAMLELHITDMQVAPFKVHPDDYTNYSWLEQHHGSAVPFNVSVACFRESEPLRATECRNVKNASAVYVRPKPYKFEPAEGSDRCEDCGDTCDDCTSDKTLLGLRHVQAHTRGLRADEHGNGADKVLYQLQRFDTPLHIVQAHAARPFGRCAALLTTRNGNDCSVVCVGDQVSTVRSCSGDRYLGALEWRFDETIYQIYLISNLNNETRAAKLIYVNDTAEIEAVVAKVVAAITKATGATLRG